MCPFPFGPPWSFGRFPPWSFDPLASSDSIRPLFAEDDRFLGSEGIGLDEEIRHCDDSPSPPNMVAAAAATAADTGAVSVLWFG